MYVYLEVFIRMDGCVLSDEFFDIFGDIEFWVLFVVFCCDFCIVKEFGEMFDFLFLIVY